MDQIKIGKFIAEERKAKKYTDTNIFNYVIPVMVSQKYHCYFHFAMN